jgi:outer membrane protein
VPSLSVPLYQGGGEYARIRQTRQALTEERFNLQATRRDVEEEIAAAWQALLTARARLHALARQVEAASLALDGVQQEARIGHAHRARRARCRAGIVRGRSGGTAAERDAVVAAYRIKAGMGLLTAEPSTSMSFFDPRPTTARCGCLVRHGRGRCDRSGRARAERCRTTTTRRRKTEAIGC